MNKSDLLQFIENSADECVALQKLLTSHKALAPENGGDGEWEKCAALEEFLRAHGITNLERFDAPDSRALHGRRPNLIATIPGKNQSAAAASLACDRLLSMPETFAELQSVEAAPVGMSQAIL